MSAQTECPLWDEPAFVRSLVPGLPAGAGRENAVLSAKGHWCNYDVYVQAPGAWLLTELELRIRCYELIERLDFKTLLDAQVPFAPQGPPITPGLTPGKVNGLLFSIRGRPCTELAVFAKSGAEALPSARFYCRAWGTETGVYGDRASRLPVDLFAGPHQEVTAHLLVTEPGPHTLSWGGIGAPFTTPPDGGRVFITSMIHTTLDGARREVSLTTFQPATAVNSLRQRYYSRDTYPIVHDFTYPLRPLRSAEWQVLISGAAAGHALSFVGFVE